MPRTFRWTTTRVPGVASSSMNAATLAELVTTPATIGSVPTDRVPGLLAELESIRAALWGRLLTPLVPRPERDCERLLGMTDVAAILDVPLQYAYTLAKRGGLPSIRFGKYVKVRVGDLEAWIAERREDFGHDRYEEDLHLTAA